MTKMKTKRAAAKRFSLTGTGKVRRAHAFHSHNFSHLSRKTKRRTRGTTIASPADTRLIKRMLPYGA